MAKKSAPTMKDVAAEAGVSLGTVSKVFNRLPVGEPYRQKVLVAADKLGYRVNNLARGMKAGKTHTAALILPDLHNQFFASLAEHISKCLKERDCRMLLYVTHSNAEEEQECLRLAEQYHVDGIIALTYSTHFAMSEGIRFVSIDRHLSANVPCVTSDNYGGGQLAVRKLMELGCRSLLGVQVSSPIPSEADKRIEGFRTACEIFGIPYGICWNNEDDRERVWDYIREHTNNGVFDYDGVFCNSDEIAYRLRETLREEGVRSPEDVQIIGFDGIRKFGTQDIYCSTIAQSVQGIAETAVALLLMEEAASTSMLACVPVEYHAGGTTRD